MRDKRVPILPFHLEPRANFGGYGARPRHPSHTKPMESSHARRSGLSFTKTSLARMEAGQAGSSGRGAAQQRVPQHCRRRSVLLEGGWAVAELAARAVRAAVVCQCGAPHARPPRPVPAPARLVAGNRQLYTIVPRYRSRVIFPQNSQTRRPERIPCTTRHTLIYQHWQGPRHARRLTNLNSRPHAHITPATTAQQRRSMAS
jgi:hypothetical protein